MKGFNFEKNLSHQIQAINKTVSVFEQLEIIKAKGTDSNCINPLLNIEHPLAKYYENIVKVQQLQQLEYKAFASSNIIDIMMETGTGKTYTYTKTIFELNKNYGIFKFVVVVPTLSIKAGTINFLKSQSAREHFKEQYGKTIHLHIVESQKGNKKNNKSFIPPSINSFVNSGNFEKNSIQLMIVNAGMINSDTMQKSFDKGLFDKYTIPFDAIGAVRPFMIIDEPHKFDQSNKTWKNIQKMKPQFILRYGATFPYKEIKQRNSLTNKIEKIKVKDYHNLIYKLSAVDSFNQNLVKGVIGHITEFENGKNAIVKLLDTNGKEASFELIESGKKKTVKLIKKESLHKVHPEMKDLLIENLNKTKVELSNGLELKKGDKINPFSYAQTLQEIMLQKAVKSHFELEKAYLTREIKIKPLTLFFIDNIEEYRNQNGYLKTTLEQLVKAEIDQLLKTEQHEFYKAYLEKTLVDISKTHAGYFSKDNSEKDEVIEQEIKEILHDKEAILDLSNPRRFIFSKWTLREGWDNPNVFQICKLRSSGSEISKLQEVGRGLRLPVNEYGNRVKSEDFYLNYFVDFTENDFVDKLINEINEKSGTISADKKHVKLTEGMIEKICKIYHTTEEDLLELLDENNIVSRSNKFKEDGFDYIKENYPLALDGIDSNKIRRASDTKKQVSIRTEKYHELKDLWEKLNEKVILEYKFDNEETFKALLTDFFNAQKSIFSIEGIKERKAKVGIEEEQAIVKEEESVLDSEITPISTMKYSDFIKELAKVLNINLKTIHHSLTNSEIKINQYLNTSSIRMIKQRFDTFLMYNAIDKFSIEYKKVSNSIHPTKITDSNGNVLPEIPASNVGMLSSNAQVADSYFFNELFYDSELEKANIKNEIQEVVVFTKIPKNSIKIPVAGGKSYSPDFAYVLNFNNGNKKLHFIVETKNVDGEDSLREEEKQKIRHAELLFKGNIKIDFKTQFSNHKMIDLIREITKE